MRDEIKTMRCPNCRGRLTVTYHPIMIEEQPDPVRWAVTKSVCIGMGQGCTLTDDQIPPYQA